MTTLATNSNLAEHYIQSVDAEALEQKVKKMYKDVAERPKEEFHFEMGREMAERLGYPSDVLDHVPPEAIDSFAGVGYYFHYTNLQAGESVVDLGSGSGMDAFFAAHIVGENGRVVGIDMTDEQLAKANNLRDSSEINNVSYLKGYIQSTPCKEKSITVFPVQVRIAYFGLLFLAQAPFMFWIFWWQLIGTSAMVLFGYCFLARCMSLMPWNKNETYTWPLFKSTFFSAPVKGNVLQGLPTITN